MKRRASYAVFACLCLFISGAGCTSGIKTDEEVSIRVPFRGEAHLRLGMDKEEVRMVWGEPDEVTVLGYNEIGRMKEEWFYFGRIPEIPVNYQYFSKNKYLYFDGNNLVSFGEERKKLETDQAVALPGRTDAE
ncbi:MAG: hypothetical protein JW844_06240 [Candidatus Omnitrophica bacterium]|nr:hypothetical protein [Candidatus Omnitrophota bacterium]